MIGKRNHLKSAASVQPYQCSMSKFSRTQAKIDPPPSGLLMLFQGFELSCEVAKVSDQMLQY